MAAIESEYICDYCSRSFTRKHNLQTHIENCHLNSTCYCDICEARFGSPAGLQLHLNRGHNRFGQPSPECDICGRIFTRKQNITSHMATVHMQSHRPDIRCHLCSKIFTSGRNLKRHLHQLHNPNFAYLFCDECNKVFKGKHSLIAHIQTVHTVNRGVVRCHLCVKVYSNKRNLKRHMEINHSHLQQEKGEFKCESCNKVYTSNQSLKRHERSMHTVDKLDYHTCKLCTKLIIGKKNYQIHTMLHHSQDRQSSSEYLADFIKEDLKCDTCNVGFDQETALRQHIKNDHGFQEFYAYCKKSLQLKSIERHRDRHKKQNCYYSCEFCSNAFYTVYDLKDHMRDNHDTEYIYTPCNVCFKKFFSKETLAIHRETCVPPANVNQCHYCDKLFTDISSLDFHVRVFHPQASNSQSHIAFGNMEECTEKIFKCTQCDRTYYSDKSLRHHLKHKHSTNDTAECRFCGKICNNKQYLESHLRLVHKIDSSITDSDKEFKTKQTIDRNIETAHVESQRYKCDECLDLFKERTSLRKHIRSKHPDSTRFSQCSYCGKRFESERSCRTHQKLTHSSYAASLCNQSGTSIGTKTVDEHKSDNHTTDMDTSSTRKSPKERGIIDQEIGNASLALKYKTPRCILCMKDFSSRKTLKRHIKKFHTEFDVDELADFGTGRPEFHIDCVDCVKNFTDDYHFSVYLKWKHLAKSIIFKCETCGSSYNALEYSIQRYKRNLDLSKNKLYLSELCTTEMSDVDTQMDYRSNVVESDAANTKYGSTDRSNPEFKSELGGSSVIKLELQDNYMSDYGIKSEPLSP